MAEPYIAIVADVFVSIFLVNILSCAKKVSGLVLVSRISAVSNSIQLIAAEMRQLFQTSHLSLLHLINLKSKLSAVSVSGKCFKVAQ